MSISGSGEKNPGAASQEGTGNPSTGHGLPPRPEGVPPEGAQAPPNPAAGEASASDTAGPALTEAERKEKESSKRRVDELRENAAKLEALLKARDESLPGLKLKEFSALEPCDIEWLWEKRVPLGKLSLLAGEPGVGKTMIACALAAAVSLGRSIIQGESVLKARVAIFSAEDGPQDTLRPRLELLGADLTRVLSGENELRGEDRAPFNLLKNADELEAMLRERTSVKLLILDPIQAYIGSGSNESVRLGLNKICALAERYGVAILGIAHLRKDANKSATDVLGATALAAMARAVWLVQRDPYHAGACLMTPQKMNLAGPSALRYRIVDGKLVWEPTPVVDFVSAEISADQSARSEVQEWLLGEILANRSTAKHLFAEARDAGFSKRTLQRVKADLGIKSKRFGGGWAWVLPKKK